MPDFTLGTLPPMCPRSIPLEKQLQAVLTGKTIVNATWEKYYSGQYSWHGDTISGLDRIINSKIVFTDASNILTASGMLIFFAYFDGGVRYYAKDEQISLPKIKKSVTHAYYATIMLDDGSSLGINQYSWATFFRVLDVNMESINEQYVSKSRRYPFIPKSPIDVTDEEDFTWEKFCQWLSDHPSLNIIESCATAKGAFRIDNPLMNYILLFSKIHPKTKTRLLSEDQKRVIYENTAMIIGEYKSGVRVCRHIDIFGNIINARNDGLWMSSEALGTPCPVCGARIEAAPAAGTKMYYCPGCQAV
jgi:hypothetical protein